MKVRHEREKQAIPLRKFRYDFYLPDANVLIEIQGGIWTKGGHSTGRGILRDMEKINLATTHGYRILLYGKDNMADFQEDWRRLND